jgi:hypothetical protein
LLDSNSQPANGRDKEVALSSGIATNSSFATNNKNFKGAISQIQQQDDSWLASEVAMVIVMYLV